MHKVARIAVALALAATCVASADSPPVRERGSASAAPSEPFLLGPPTDGGPVLVRAAFQVRDINEIDDEAETFEFGGWRWAPTMWRP